MVDNAPRTDERELFEARQENAPADGLDVAAPEFAALDVAALDVAALVELHHAELYRYAYRLTGSVADAEDLTQHVFLVVQTKGSTLRDAGCVRSWLFTVLRNTYLKQRRRPPPLLAASLEIDLGTVPAADSVIDHSDIVHSDIDTERLQSALDDLPGEFKMVLLLFYFEDCSYREIAERLNIPQGTVMSRLSRAKRHLRNRLVAAETQDDGGNAR